MSTKTVRNIREPLKKPRPLKSATSVELPKEGKDLLSVKARSDLLSELEILNIRISNADFEDGITADISLMCSLLKKHGEELDASHKDALDRFFCTLRNACREDRLDVLSRLKLLEVIELRAMQWKLNENLCNYFNSRYTQLEEASDCQNVSGSVSPNVIMNSQSFANTGGLAPGEFLRSSGKFSKPTKIAGKNYYKDEIVIRNCDSGKVMGIKGRRVHMIEELSDTVISFQRVNAGARDRLVQITGPHEESISHAKFLVEDTIKRNVSPVRDNLTFAEVTLDKEHVDYGTTFFDRSNQQVSSKRNLTHSYSMSDASSRELSMQVNIGNDVITLIGSKPELLKSAKNVLTEYFGGHYDVLEKDSVLLTSVRNVNAVNNNQRFTLKKQASLKDNLPSSYPSSIDQGFSRQSSSMSSSSDDNFPDEESSDLEAVISPDAVPIPPPSYPPTCHVYSRQFLLECARLPLSHRRPSDFDSIAAAYPEIVAQCPTQFNPSALLCRATSPSEGVEQLQKK